MAGYTKNYSIAVWTGYDHPMAASPISDTYTESAQQLYKDEMQYLDSQNHASNWKMPDTVEAVRVNGKRQLVIKDSKWALQYAAIDDDDDEDSSSSSSSGSSSLRDSITSSETVFGNDRNNNGNNDNRNQNSTDTSSTNSPSDSGNTSGGTGSNASSTTNGPQ